ncbi:MAG: OSTA/TMEM184 family protein [bacterium]
MVRHAAVRIRQHCCWRRVCGADGAGTVRGRRLYSTGKVTLVQGAVIIASLQPMALAVLMADGLLPGTPIFDTPARSTLWNNLLVCFEALLLFVITLRGFPVCVRAD